MNIEKILAGLLMGLPYAMSGQVVIDDDAQTIYVKVVNVGDGHADGVVNLSNCEIDTGKDDALQLIRLSAGKGSHENSIAKPHNVIPANGNIKRGAYGEVLFDVPPYSVNIIKIKTRP